MKIGDTVYWLNGPLSVQNGTIVSFSQDVDGDGTPDFANVAVGPDRLIYRIQPSQIVPYLAMLAEQIKNLQGLDRGAFWPTPR